MNETPHTKHTAARTPSR